MAAKQRNAYGLNRNPEDLGHSLSWLQGKIAERAKEDILETPQHEYTEQLLSSVPETDPDWLDNLLAERRDKIYKEHETS